MSDIELVNEVDRLFTEAYELFQKQQRPKAITPESDLLTFDEGLEYQFSDKISDLALKIKEGKEVEVRFGTYQDDRFVPGVPKDYFYNLLTVLSRHMPNVKPVNRTSYINDDVRVQVVNGQETAERKIREEDLDDHFWGIRISTSTEEKIAIPKDRWETWFKRTGTRWSFPLKGRQLDLTIVSNGANSATYEVEIEWNKSQGITSLYKDVAITLSHMQRTHIDQILSLVNRNIVLHNYNVLFVGPDKIDTVKWVKERFDKTENKPQSFDWNNVFTGKYYITPKLDGLRRRLFFDNNGVFEISPDSNFVRQIAYPTDEVGTVVDTEFYEGKYYPFDILVSNGILLLDEPFESRKVYLNNLSFPLFDL